MASAKPLFNNALPKDTGDHFSPVIRVFPVFRFESDRQARKKTYDVGQPENGADPLQVQRLTESFER
jgi:hypothetical protein